ncbi:MULTISPECIES: type II 3-dehydroquinate dehydratase [Paraburkholderia]|jgi:3-dehydroquinate dehydratase-2|uniref:3-dehydroquinate dehydratase n=1 Tax=Paraburkholderia largidicola TaxID=3014751 RepID=A0A7I8C0G0_9BURK|nr:MULTISPECIES: type II 3-dehydroquinate dehydratase [Paraburkholderia]BEU27829.1 type II 3-dehydroquinate dehydratase [Paraburkholderia sp. 22B1P]GJH36012.1 type II 3-dehydroquinate dehydratase [Paraburkholderia hospita]CAG9242227.1 3-dehydroquinate dehydratase 1 [Paraburkholderia caribensis]BCF94547.1 3-dehydroquinate dehydratase [Paraburkholderia sp. PGU16]GJH03302.1 type II 3-dehydroquinate dehydratase [Paraburkholderia terrae]
MKPTVYVLNGSNLNMLGKREPHLYGTTTLAQIKERTEALAEELGVRCEFRQTNHEGVMVDWLQEAYEADAAVVINPAGFSFASIPVLDAVKLIRQPVIEVHITNIHQRDEQYRHSLISLAARGVICGLGPDGYLLAMRAVASSLSQQATAAR